MRLSRFLGLSLLALGTAGLNPAVAGPSGWGAQVDPQSGLPAFGKGGVTALSAIHGYWARNWQWAGVDTRFRVLGPFDYGFTGANPSLELKINGAARRIGRNQVVWELELVAARTIEDAIGGGMIVRFDLAKFAAELGDPELLPEGRGWSWGRNGASRVVVRFDPAPAGMHFEQGRKDELRVMFYRGRVAAGTLKFRVAMTLSDDVSINPTEPERYGPEEPQAWPVDRMDWRTSPVDLSFLNAREKPAGRRGFLGVSDDRLAFQDGTVARFWGTNLTAAALFETPKAAVREQARRLSELGFNLVRFHHHDSYWVSPNVFGARDASNTGTLHPEMMDRLDWWIKCLKDEGIYVWLDLHVQRALRATDQIDSFGEIARGRDQAELKGFNYVNPSIQAAMRRFNDAYVAHRNNHTGIQYKDEPAIVAMLITNENDLTTHYGNALLPDKNVPIHNAYFMREAEAFAKAHSLPKDRTWRSWEHGPAKLFLSDLERRFNVEMLSSLRAAGVRVPVATTSTWGWNPLSAIAALTSGQIVDVHAYGRASELEKDPAYAPTMAHWIAAANVAGKPTSVTEWNVEPFPAADRHGLPLFVAGSAGLHGWNALMQYAYGQIAFVSPGGPSNWHAYNDPALIATLPAAALLYREAHVRMSHSTYAFAPDPGTLFGRNVSPENSVALRTAAERGRLVVVMPRTKELPWLEAGTLPAGATVFTDPAQSFLPTDAIEAVSDTGQLRRNWRDGVFVIDTPWTQAATGWIGARATKLHDVEIAAITRNASVAVQSLDGKAIHDSRQILISFGARSVPEQGNQLPFRSEPVTGRVTIAAAPGLRLYKRIAAGGKLSAVPSTYRAGRYVVDLDRSLDTHWLFLQ